MCSNEGPLLLFGKTRARGCLRGDQRLFVLGFVVFFSCARIPICVCVCYPFTVFLKKKKSDQGICLPQLEEVRSTYLQKAYIRA